MKLATLSFLGFALTVLAAGCNRAAGDPADEELAGDGSEAMSASSQSTHLGNIVFESINQTDPSKAAAQAVGNPTALWPKGCVTREKDATNPLVVHVHFSDCTGPFGLVHLNGEEIVTFSANDDGSLHASLVGNDLSANGKPITHGAEADITIEGATRHVVWQGGWERVNAKGVTVKHTSDLTIDVDTAAGCATTNGNASTTVGARGVDTTMSDLKICKNPDGEAACPTGTVTHTGKVSMKTVTITFDGSDSAEVTTPKGYTFDVPLVCPAQAS